VKNKATEWYVVPGNGQTNEVIAQSLATTCDTAGNDLVFNDSDGIERKGWRVEYRVITELTRNERSMNLSFSVFVCEPGRPQRLYRLHKKKKTSNAEKKIKAELEKIK